MRRQPVNVAFDPAVIRRIRLVAASNGERPAEVVERLALAALPQEELQAAANVNARKKGKTK